MDGATSQEPPGFEQVLTAAGWFFYTAGLVVMAGMVFGAIALMWGAFRHGAFAGFKIIMISALAGTIISSAGLILGKFMTGVSIPTVVTEAPPWLAPVLLIIGWAIFIGSLSALVLVVAGAVWMIVRAYHDGVFQGGKAIVLCLIGGFILSSAGTLTGYFYTLA